MTANDSRSTRREDLITLLLALWTLIGLLVDAFYHSTDAELESFWTPWHGLFYSGFTATAGWLGWMALKRSRDTGNWLDWAPIGYRPALVGVVLFAVGGVGDAVWHTLFGVETSVDALLSPTHLLLFVGLLMILSAPLRSAWSGPGSNRPGFGEFVVPLASLVFTSTLVAFMLSYTWAPSMIDSMRIPYDPNDGFSELLAERLVAAVILTTLVMFVPLLAVRLRWRLPFGSATLFLTFLGTAIALGFDEELIGVPAIFVAGLVLDALVVAGARRAVITAVPPLVLWGLLFATVGATGSGLGLAPEIWGGAVVLASMALLAVELLVTVVENQPDRAGQAPAAPVGTAPEGRVGTAPERRVGTSPERRVGTAPERRVGTAPERRVGTAPERRVGTSPAVARPTGAAVR